MTETKEATHKCKYCDHLAEGFNELKLHVKIKHFTKWAQVQRQLRDWDQDKGGA